MRGFALVKEVQLAAIPTLVKIAARYVQYPEFIKTSLAGVLVDVMKAQSHDKNVQDAACEAMGLISCSCQSELFEAGAVGLLVQAMTRFEPSCTAVGALAHMATTPGGLHDSDAAINIQWAVIEAGVVPLLVVAMAKHADDRSFLSACMQCLRTLARHNADLLVKAGVPDALFDILHARSRAVAAAAKSLEGGGFTHALPVEALKLLCVMQQYEGCRPIDFFCSFGWYASLHRIRIRTHSHENHRLGRAHIGGAHRGPSNRDGVLHDRPRPCFLLAGRAGQGVQ
jgi:hypothetical protein